MELEAFAYPIALRISLFCVFAISTLLIVSAILSAKSMGGQLGMGLKKIAGGAIIHASLFVMTILMDQGWVIILSPSSLRVFFIVAVIVGSSLLIMGFFQIYRISKELKLFY